MTSEADGGYCSGNPCKDFEDIYSIMPINLFGINVRVLQVINPKYRKYQNAELVTWWRKYFAKAKGPAKIWSKL